MNLGLEGCVAIVTGATRGLGRASVEALLAEGVRILGAARDREALADLEGVWPNDFVGVACDLSDRSTTLAMPSLALEHFGRLDIVVNNAGVTGGSDLLEQDWDQWDRLLAVNVTAPAVLSSAAARCFAAQGSGKIINVASTTSIRGVAGRAGYSTSKGALLQLTRSLALEWASIGVQVNAIGPGAFETGAQRELLNGPRGLLKQRLESIPDRRMGRPEEVAALVCFLASRLADHITGALYMIDGGESAQLIR